MNYLFLLLFITFLLLFITCKIYENFNENQLILNIKYMSNLNQVEIIADTLLESIRVVASAILTQAENNVADVIINKVESYLDLLVSSVSRFQTVSNLIATANKENRDLTDAEVAIAQGFYNDALAEAEADLKS